MAKASASNARLVVEVTMRTMVLLTMVLVLVLAIPVAVAAPRVMTWTVDGVKREALVFEPVAGPEKRPLVFAFHGHGGNMQTFAKLTALETHWPQAIVVYPQGLPTVSRIDPKGVQPGWQHVVGDDRDRDLKFVDAMLETFRRENRADEQRTYAMGFSNGAIFSLLLWEERSEAFASFAIAAGALEQGQHLDSAKPVLQIAGTNDPLITPPRVEQTIAQERRANNANGGGTDCGTGCTSYRGDVAEVRVLEHAGGHVYPSQASEQVVEFFRTSRVPKAGSATAAPASAGESLPKADIIQYKSHDGDLLAFVYKPAGNGPFPVYMWNHGSERDPMPAAWLAKFWLQRGFLVFVPLRAGHGPNPGKWIVDEQKLVRDQGSPTGFRKLMTLHEHSSDDVVAAYNWIARQTFVDPKRIVVAGGSFGAIQALLLAERDSTELLGVKCVVAMAPASESWANPNWASRLTSAIDRTRAPIFLMEAANDFSLGPDEVLGPRLDAKGFPNRHKVFPSHGDPNDHAQGHGAFFADPRAWGDDLLAFLHDCGEM
jgi:polyhydroxybutyrate depolymerase